MKFDFIAVDYDYFDFNGKNYVRIIGRNSKNEKVCLISHYDASFYVILKEGISKDKIRKLIEKIKKIEVEKGNRTTKVVDVKLQNKKFLGKEVEALEIFIDNYKDAHEVASMIGDSDEIVARREYDINLITKYIMKNGIEPMQWYSVNAEKIEKKDFGLENLEIEACFIAKDFSKTKQKNFSPKVLAYDIETDNTIIGKGNVLMISLFGKNFKKVLTWKHSKSKQDYVECFDDEKSMLEAFVEYVKKYSPDVLCGYFSDGFDLPYLRERAEKNKIKLGLGIDGSSPAFLKGRIASGKISGIVHIDLFRFIESVFSQYLQSETLSLNEVAGELIGEYKEDFDFMKLGNMKEDDWRDFFSYCMQDSTITYKLAEKVLCDIMEFSRIIKEPLFEISRDGMSSHVENYILHNLSKFNEIAEKRPGYDEIQTRRAMEKYEGAFVYEPIPGLYENIAMFDFTSMYASIIVSYNLSKSTFIDEKNGNYEFSKRQGFFPELLSDIIKERKKYKEIHNKEKSSLTKARSNAYKLLANASYGYLGFAGARYYSRESASSTTKFARETILDVIDKIKEKGFKILYGDTDSIAFLIENNSHKEVLDFLKKLNNGLPGIMELDLENFYKRGIFVSKKIGKSGAKKKYALIDYKDNLKIRGFETVRRDWCGLARNLQSKILNSILKTGKETEALKLFTDIVEKLKKRKIILDDLIIMTQLRKALNDYAVKSPHVVAAEKIKELGLPISEGMLVRYFIGEGKGKRISDKVFLPNEDKKYDIDYYLNNQILPSVENIFEVFGINVNNIISGKKQTHLMDFNNV